MGPFQEAGPCFIDSIMKHLNIKRMPTCSQQVASMNRSQLYLWKSSKKNNTFESPESRKSDVKFSLTRFKKSKGMAECICLSSKILLHAMIILAQFDTLFSFESGCSLHSRRERGASWPSTRSCVAEVSVHIPKAERRNATRRFSTQPRECVHNLDALHYRPLTRFHNYY